MSASNPQPSAATPGAGQVRSAFSIARGAAADKGKIVKQQTVTLAELGDILRESQAKPVAFTVAQFAGAPKVERDKLKATPWYVCASFSGNQREKSALTSCGAVVLDADKSGATREALIGALNALGCSYIVATSTSHGVAGQPRFRVIVPLASPVNLAQYKTLWQFLSKQLPGTDTGAKDGSRLNYLPRVPQGAAGHEVVVVDDRPWLDATPVLAEPSTDKSAPTESKGAAVTLTEDQLSDVRTVLQHPAVLAAAAENGFWSNSVGYPLKKHGLEQLWLEFSRAAPNYTEGAAQQWWDSHSEGDADFRHLLTEAARVGCQNPRTAVISEAIDFPVVSPETQDAAKPSRFKPVPVDEFASGPEPKWIIDGVVPRSELMVVYGEPACGKSFFVADMGAAIARGVKWRNRDVVQGRVAYICAESASGFRQRWRAYASVNGITLADMNESLFMIVEAPNLLQANDIGELILQLQAIGSFAFIAIDTLARATPGGNENSGEDMGLALAHCKAIHKATGALVCLVHHSGKDQARGARGWSGIRGAVDTEIEVTRVRGNIRQAAVSKQRDGEDGLKFEFSLETAAAGNDAKGRPASSLVVRALESVARNSGIAAPMKPPTSLNQRAVWNALDEAQRDMDIGELITNAVGRLAYDPKDSRDRRREVVTRAINKMLADGVLISSGNSYGLRRPAEFPSVFDPALADLLGDLQL